MGPYDLGFRNRRVFLVYFAISKGGSARIRVQEKSGSSRPPRGSPQRARGFYPRCPPVGAAPRILTGQPSKPSEV